MPLANPSEMVKLVQKDDLFQQWERQHKGYLTHLFCSISSDFLVKTDWEVGFFDSEQNKITVFARENGTMIVKPADDVFRQPGTKIEELRIREVKVTPDEAITAFKENYPAFFPKEVLGDGFLIVQSFQGKVLWNISFITKSLKFVNIKIDAGDGKIESHDSFSLIDKGPSSA